MKNDSILEICERAHDLIHEIDCDALSDEEFLYGEKIISERELYLEAWDSLLKFIRYRRGEICGVRVAKAKSSQLESGTT